MISWIKRLLRREETTQREKDSERIKASIPFNLIEKEWSNQPAVFDIRVCNSFADIESFPRNGEKNEIFLGIIPWPKQNVDALIYTKHNQYGEYTLDKPFNLLVEEELKHLGLLPLNSQMICSRCEEYSTYLNEGLECYDCS